MGLIVFYILGGQYQTLTTNQEASFDQTSNKQNLTDTQYRIEPHELSVGGPTKDGIPAIDTPQFIPISQSSFPESHTVIGVYTQGIAKAYPYGILNWHEIINDRIGDLPISVTLCPLCDTNPVFIRKVMGQETTFGVSGKLYQSCLIMYDRTTNSLWSQVWGLGINGQANNLQLKRIPAVKTTLGQWKAKHPDSLILSTETGYKRSYSSYPYGDYNKARYLVFPVRHLKSLIGHPKATESYIYIHDKNKPINYFSGYSYTIKHETLKEKKEIIFQLNGKKYRATWDDGLGTVKIYLGSREIPSSTAYSFVYPSYFLH